MAPVAPVAAVRAAALRPLPWLRALPPLRALRALPPLASLAARPPGSLRLPVPVPLAGQRAVGPCAWSTAARASASSYAFEAAVGSR